VRLLLAAGVTTAGGLASMALHDLIDLPDLPVKLAGRPVPPTGALP
jgi:hypothetical protein